MKPLCTNEDSVSDPDPHNLALIDLYPAAGEPLCTNEASDSDPDPH